MILSRHLKAGGDAMIVTATCCLGARRWIRFIAILLIFGACSGAQADWAVILDDPIEAGSARIDIIQQAHKTIDVEYYAIQKGDGADLFLALLFDAADRGVHVRLLLDGLSNGLLPSQPEIVEAIVSHPKMEIRFFNTFKATRSSTWNERLHDKLVLVDGQQLVAGGRNIGDRYFEVPGYTKPKTRDRDVYILGDPNGDDTPEEVSRYFDAMWSSDRVDITKVEKKLNKECRGDNPTSRCRKKKAARARAAADWRQRLSEDLAKEFKERPESYFTGRDWSDGAIEPDSIRFVYDPIGEKSESTGTAAALYEAFDAAQESIIIQSPYTIPTPRMMEAFRSADDRGIGMVILTNSPGSSPNIFAMSGYRHYRKHMVDAGIDFHEFQGRDNIHAKSFIIDGRLSMIGSLNLDPRSLRTNTELIFLIDSPEFAEEFLKVFEHHGGDAVLVDRKGKAVDPEAELIKGSVFKRGLQRFLSWFAPLYRNVL